MAANFGDTIMEGAIAPSVKVQAPVEDNSGAILAEGFAGAAKVIGATVGDIFNRGQEDASAKILSAYENDLLDLADAVDQGQDRDWAMTQARLLRRQYLSNAPALQEDFDKVWSNFAGANGLGHVAITGTIEQQAQEAVTQEAIKLGYPSVEAYRQFQLAGQQAAAISQQFETIKANNGIITETMKNQGLQAVTNLATTAFPAAQTQINQAMAQIQANPENKAAIVQQLNLNLGANIEQLSALAGNADGAFITTPITNLLGNFNKWASGEIEVGMMENDMKLTAMKYEAMLSSDPVLGPYISASKLLNSVGLNDSAIAGKLLTPEVIKALEAATKGNVNILANNDTNERVTQSLNEAISQPLDAEGAAELQQVLGGIVDGAYLNERTAQDGALGFKGTIEVIGSPATTEFVRANGPLGNNSQHGDKFVEVLRNNFENEFLPVVRSYWESVPVVSLPDIGTPGENAGGVNNIPMNQLLDVVWNGTAVEFVPKPEYAENPRIRGLANTVNTGSNSIGVPMNNLIRAYSNVTGVDPKQVWEQQFANVVFGAGAEGEQSLSDKANRILTETDPNAPTISDFNLEDEAVFEQSSALLDPEMPALDPAYTDVEGVDYNSYLPSIRRSESGGNDSAKNSSSTATGRYQFLKSTWTELVDRYPNSGLSYDGRLDPQQQEVAIRLFTAENARMLKNRGVPLNNGTLYAAHFLGASDAVKVLQAEGGSVADYVPARVINANKFLRGMSVAEFKRWAQRKGNA